MNYEAVDKYGISLSASTLENSEFVKSLGKSWNQLSDNEKMMAAYNEMTRQGASAQGLAKQEAESFGMKFKLLKQQISETVGEIGTNLLPVLEPMVKKFSEITSKIAEWVGKNPELTQQILVIGGGIGLLLATIGPLLIAIGQMTIGITTLIPVFTSIGTLITGTLIPALTAAGVVIGGLTIPVWGVIAGITALIAVGVLLYQNWDTVKAKCSEVWSYICDAISEFVSNSIQWIKDKWEEGKQWIIDCWENIKQSAIDIWNSIGDFFSETIPKWIDNIVNWFNELPYNIGYALGELLANIVLWGIDTWNYFSENVPMWIESISNWFSELPGKIWQWLSDCIEKVLTWGTNTYNKAKEWITKTIEGIGQWFSQLPGIVWQWLSQTVDRVVEFGRNMLQKGKEAAQETSEAVRDGFKNLPSKIKDVGREIVQGLWSGISGMYSWIKGKISGFIDGIIAGFSGVFSKVQNKVNGRSIENIEEVDAEYINPYEVDYSKVKFNYANAKQTSISDAVAKNNLIVDKFNNFTKGFKTDNKEANVNTENSININLNIDKFINERKQDVKELMQEMTFEIKRQRLGFGGVR